MSHSFSVTNEDNSQSTTNFNNYSSHGSTSSTNKLPESIQSISNLTPYQNRWTVRARVIVKKPVRNFKNGTGRLFSVNFLDESGEIRACGFNEIIDKFYELLKIRKVYFISKCTIKLAKKSFTSVKHDYEMIFNSDTIISLCNDPCPSIPMYHFNFVPIPNIEEIDNGAIIDVIGICKNISDVTSVISQYTGEKLNKRDIILVDENNLEIKLTIWKEDAENFNADQNSVIAVKEVKVKEFNGKCLSLVSSGVLYVNPDIRERHFRKEWLDRKKCSEESIPCSTSLSRPNKDKWKSFFEMEMVNEVHGWNYFNNKAAIIEISKNNCMYMSCPSNFCKKKVKDLNNGMYQCDKCCKDYSNFKWRLSLLINVADYTANQWVICFQEVAESILGITAEELVTIREEDENKFTEIISENECKVFNFKVKTRICNGKNRLKIEVISAKPINYVSYGNMLLKNIKNKTLFMSR